MAYLLDANIFIQAKNLHYGFDFCPAFWDWLLEKNAEQKVFSIEQVGSELEAGDDELSKWAQERGSGFFRKLDNSVAHSLRTISSWAISQNYEPAAANTFLQVADYYLTGQALARNHTIVTHEKASISTKRIKIPDVCIGLGISFMTPYEMLRHERARFVLGL